MLAMVGDFGGTNCRLGLVRAGQLDHTSVRSYANSGFAGPSDAIAHYLQENNVGQVSAVCLGAAGPVQADAVQLTNHPWRLTAPELSQVTGATRVILLNDLQAQGYALHGLRSDDTRPILPGAPSDPQATRMIIAIGTGMNAAVGFCRDGQIFVPPSESGHMALALEDETDLAFAAVLKQELGHCPVEAALSGDGLARLWRFFGGPAQAQGQDVMHAFAHEDAAATKAVQRFSLYLARYAADLALIHLPMGGIYMAGSVGKAIAPHLTQLGFAAAFRRAGPYAGIYRAIPVVWVPQVPLTLEGCATRLAQDGT